MLSREKFIWAAVFGAIGGIITVLCLDATWITEKTGTGSESALHHFRELDEKFIWAAVFGAIGGIIIVLCLNAACKAERAEGEIDIQYEHPRNFRQPEENDERFCATRGDHDRLALN